MTVKVVHVRVKKRAMERGGLRNLHGYAFRNTRLASEPPVIAIIRTNDY